MNSTMIMIFTLHGRSNELDEVRMVKSCSYVHFFLKKLDIMSKNDLVVDSLYCNLSSDEFGHSLSSLPSD